MSTKFLGVFVLALLGTNANAGVSQTVFDCRAEIQIDATETQKIGMTVKTHGTDLVAYYVGASQPGPLATVKQVLSLQDGLKVSGVNEILSTLSLSVADRAKIASITVYTEGNFEDDLAGVRAVEFADAQGAVLSKGMYFGWAGPVRCL